MDKLITKASTATLDTTYTAIDASIGKVCSTIDDCYDKHINNMDVVFNENMGLMEDIHSSFRIQDICTCTTTEAHKTVDNIIKTKMVTVTGQITYIYQEIFDDA